MAKLVGPTDAIDLDDIDILDAFECVVVMYDPGDLENGPRIEMIMLDVDSDGHVYDEQHALRKIFGHEE